MDTKLISLFVLFSFFVSCKPEKKQVSKNIPKYEYPNKCDSNYKSKDTVTKTNQKITFEETLYANVNLYKNNTNNTYFIKNNLGKIKLENLYFFSRIQGGFQALNKDNEIIYYNLKLEKSIDTILKPEFYGVCGNVPCWKLTIEERKNDYVIKKKAGHSGSYDAKWANIDSISKNNNIIDVNFLNKTKELQYDGNFISPETILIKYDKGFGIRTNYKTYSFDTIDTSSSIKVGCNQHFGYFEISEIKYKRLDSFKYNLAYFELDNGKKGYIDRLGNEYYKQ